MGILFNRQGSGGLTAKAPRFEILLIAREPGSCVVEIPQNNYSSFSMLNLTPQGFQTVRAGIQDAITQIDGLLHQNNGKNCLILIIIFIISSSSQYASPLGKSCCG